LSDFRADLSENVITKGKALMSWTGPMLLHGLQGFQGGRIHVPRAERLKPNREFLAERYELFRRAS
jgi:hypothetical protein